VCGTAAGTGASANRIGASLGIWPAIATEGHELEVEWIPWILPVAEEDGSPWVLQSFKNFGQDSFQHRQVLRIHFVIGMAQTCRFLFKEHDSTLLGNFQLLVLNLD